VIDPREFFRFEPRKTESGFETRWKVPRALPYFDGHFLDKPVLPAVGILDATLALITQAGGLPAEKMKNVKQAKFVGIVSPETEVVISVIPSGDNEWTAEWKTPSADPEAKNLLAEISVTYH